MINIFSQEIEPEKANSIPKSEKDSAIFRRAALLLGSQAFRPGSAPVIENYLTMTLVPTATLS